MAKDLVPLRLEIAGMANRLFELVGFRPAEATEKQRQQLAAYAFGMAFALGQDHHLSPPEVHGLTISYLRDVFKYGDMQVVQFSDLLIQATASPSPQPKLKAIGHRGIDGYVLLKQKQIDRLREDLQDLLGLARIAQAPAVPAAPKPSFRAAREPDRDLIKHLVLGGDPVNFLWLVPITRDECAFILKRSPQEFLDLMHEYDHPIVLDERRKSYCRSKRG